MDGWPCLTELKNDERYKNIPVIIISTSSHKTERDIAQQLGAHGYFIKASNFDVLKRSLKSIVEGLENGLAKALLLLQAESSNIFSFAEKK